MAYKFRSDETVGEGLRRAALEQIEKAIEAAERLDRREAVHETRKRCKKIRGLIRACRPSFEDTYQRENARFRDAARELSDLRDATSMIECVDALAERYGSEAGAQLCTVREVLEASRSDLEEKQDVGEKLLGFAETMEEAKGAIDRWELEDEGFAAIGPGAKKTYKRARKAMEAAATDPSGERYHEWRKRVKYHCYHCKLLRDAWPEAMMDRRDEAKRLSDYLGDGHDLDILRDAIIRQPARFGGSDRTKGALALIDARRQELRSWAGPVGLRLFAEKPGRFRRRLGALHSARRQEVALESSLPERSGEVYS